MPTATSFPSPVMTIKNVSGHCPMEGKLAPVLLLLLLLCRSSLCNPIDGSPPGSPIPGSLQARSLEWVESHYLEWCARFSKWKTRLQNSYRVQPPLCLKKKKFRDFHDDPVDKKTPSNAGDADLIPVGEQRLLGELRSHRVASQLERSPSAAKEGPTHCD